MVNTIDIHSLTLEELNGVIALYPWYGGARMELCNRMAGMGALTQSQASETAMYIGSRRLLYNLVNGNRRTDCADKDIKILVSRMIDSPATENKPRVHVIGGDYFSQAQYNTVRHSDDNVFSRFAAKAKEEGFTYNAEEEDTDFCTETIAKIYLEQDYKDKAIEIYSKLILRYPEKNAYFAALIDEINKNR